MPDIVGSSNETYFVPDGVNLPGPTDSSWTTEAGRDFLRSKGIVDDRLGNGPLINDSENDAIEKLAKDLNIKLSDETKDYLTQYYLNEKSAENSYKRSLDASNTQYQRAVADLRKAGLNPFLAIQSLSGSAPSSQTASVQGGIYTSRTNQKTQSGTQAATSILGVLGIIAAALIHALL